MFRKFSVCLIAWFLASTAAIAGRVNVADSFVGSMTFNEVIAAQQYKLIPLGPWRAGDKLVIQVGARNAVFDDITACVLTEDEARSYQPRGGCRGRVKTKTPFTLQWQIEGDAKYFLVLDNTFANFIKKTVGVDVKFQKILSQQEVARLAVHFEGTRASVERVFENADFNINVKPCGQSNAYSDNKTADITICSEIMSELQSNPGALAAILLHEYGHSLLNRWGEPGASEEDMADQFATVSLLRAGDQGRELLLQWIQFWERRDSRAEAQNQLVRGDTHTLSIQRARNIRQNMSFPEEFTRRWNKMLYRHMTKQALQQTITQPRKSDDIDLAQEALRAK
ncbi:MAG: hypothetical protein HYX43_04195 [Burkholderiales bacterium]|nr:hypothetical protein [Burkholderiales bacterium]